MCPALGDSAVMSSVSDLNDNKYTSTQLDNLRQADTQTVCNVFEPSSVAAKFLDTTILLTEMLQSSNKRIIVNTCNLLKASEQANIPLFSAHYLEILTESESTPTLVKKLVPFTNWIDHSILTAVAEACNVPEAAALLRKFDTRIDTSQPVTKYPIPAPSHHMVPYDTSTHTVLAVQLNLQLHHSTLQKVLDTRLLIQEKCEVTPHCVQLLAMARTSHTIIYWTIPKHVVVLVALNILQHQSYFYKNGIEQVALYPGLVLFTGSALTVGLFTFFAKVSSLTML